MNCDHCQQLLSEALDASTGIPSDASLHLGECSRCRTFQSSLDVLDELCAAQLAGGSGAPAGFKAQLLQCLPEREPKLLPWEVAERIADLDQEYQAALARLNREFLVQQMAVGLRMVARGGACWFLILLLTEVLQGFSLPPGLVLLVVLGGASAFFGMRHSSILGILRHRFFLWRV